MFYMLRTEFIDVRRDRRARMLRSLTERLFERSMDLLVIWMQDAETRMSLKGPLQMSPRRLSRLRLSQQSAWTSALASRRTRDLFAKATLGIPSLPPHYKESAYRESIRMLVFFSVSMILFSG